MGIRVQKKQHMWCFVGEEQRMHINYMQSKISVIVRFVFKKVFAYMLSLRRRTTNELVYFFLNTNLTDLTNLDTACSVNQAIGISVQSR